MQTQYLNGSYRWLHLKTQKSEARYRLEKGMVFYKSLQEVLFLWFRPEAGKEKKIERIHIPYPWSSLFTTLINRTISRQEIFVNGVPD